MDFAISFLTIGFLKKLPAFPSSSGLGNFDSLISITACLIFFKLVFSNS
jgi:hypothetical protein